MQPDEALIATVIRIVQEAIGNENSVGPDDPLLASGLVDSLNILQIYLALQSETGAELDIDDITDETFASVRSVANLVESRIR